MFSLPYLTRGACQALSIQDHEAGEAYVGDAMTQNFPKCIPWNAYDYHHVTPFPLDRETTLELFSKPRHNLYYDRKTA